MANKGEWSELYVAIRILADCRLYLIGNDGHRNMNEWMDVKSLYRIESAKKGSKRGNRKVRYIVNMDTCKNDKGEIEITVDNVSIKTINIDRFRHIAEVLKNDIISGKSSSISVSQEVKDFLVEAEIHSIKAKSIDKSDVFLTIRDPRSSVIRNDIGFSIKSEFGKDPTIFNTAPASGVKYKLSKMTDALMKEINDMVDNKGKAAVMDRCKKLIGEGCELTFVGYSIAKKAKEPVFCENIDTINPRLPDVIERIMWNYYIERKTERNIPDAVDIIISQNPCKVSRPEIKYPVMIKNFLYIAYCAMTASTLWEGKSRVNGGLISVNRQGEVMASYAMESDSFKDFLYNNCYLDQPSTSSKHGDFARVYKENGEYYFNLNFQIKMRKANK